MKKILIALFLLFSLYCFGKGPLSEALYDETGGPSKPLLEILNAYKIDHNGSWPSIVKETQSKWLRPDGTERWNVVGEIKQDNYDLFSKLNMTNTINSSSHCYDYGVVLGSTVQRVRSRLFFLKKEWERGIRFQKIVFLTGDRPLDKIIENERELIDPAASAYPFRKDWVFSGEFPKNETDMMLFIFNQLEMPFDLRHTELIIIDAPQKNGKRPNTKDTFCKWLDIRPEPGSVLIISDQPFLGRGDTIAREMLPCFQIETVGEGFSHVFYLKEKRATPILLDELARWIFEERFKMCNEAS